jgi:hypothetical protein
LLANFGWFAVNWVVFPPVLLGLTVLLVISFAKQRAAAQPQAQDIPNSLE